MTPAALEVLRADLRALGFAGTDTEVQSAAWAVLLHEQAMWEHARSPAVLRVQQYHAEQRAIAARNRRLNERKAV